MKKHLCVLTAILLFCTTTAAALPEMGEIKAKSAALYDSSGQMLYEMNAEQPLQPASVTKIMTMLLAMEALDRGEISLDTKITGSAHAASMGGTQIWLKEGEQLTLDEMLKAIAVGSANDCAVAVAEHLAGSEENFVQKMNERAKELGCTNTTFINANGLDADGQTTLTSARDLAIISAELLKHPKILEYTTIWMDTIRNGEFSLANTNKMLKTYDGMIGLKTGFITEAGYCIAAAATRGDITLIATVMGAATKEDRTAAVQTLLDYGFANYIAYTPDFTEACTPIAVELGQQDSVSVEVEQLSPMVISKDAEHQITMEVEREEPLNAPVSQGQEVGSVTIRDGTRILQTVKLFAGESVEKLRFSHIYHTFLQYLLMKQV